MRIHFADQPQFKIPKTNFLSQRGATGDSYTCKKFQPPPPTPRSIVCASHTDCSRIVSLCTWFPSLGSPSVEPFVFWSWPLLFHVQDWPFDGLPLLELFPLHLAFRRCVLLFAIAFVCLLSLCQCSSFGLSLSLACSAGHVSFPPSSTQRPLRTSRF